MQGLDRVTVYLLQAPLKVPYRLVFGPVTHFDTIIAEVTDRDGNTGFGEAPCAEPLTGATPSRTDPSAHPTRMVHQ